MQNNLTEKVSGSNLDPHAREEIVYILESLVKSKEMFNYIFIFAVSGLAIVLDLLLMVLKR